jgi:hypothetical protein
VGPGSHTRNWGEGVGLSAGMVVQCFVVVASPQCCAWQLHVYLFVDI